MSNRSLRVRELTANIERLHILLGNTERDRDLERDPSVIAKLDHSIERIKIQLEAYEKELASLEENKQEKGNTKSTKAIRVLHLSDLHFGPDDDPYVKLRPLVRDLNDQAGGLGFDSLDYVVISGDLTNRASVKEFEVVSQFISALVKQFQLPISRCIIVPGNHDLDWDVDAYEWRQKRRVDISKLIKGNYLEQGTGYLIRKDVVAYSKRFENFSKFYSDLTRQVYPLTPNQQHFSYLFDATPLQFLVFNSAWEIDEFFPERSSINSGALTFALDSAENELKRAQSQQQFSPKLPVLRIAVWHHPVTGNEKIVNDTFLEQLRQEGIKLCLHGHIHEDRVDLVGYLHPRKLHIVGAGSFGAGSTARPEATPRLYNLLEIKPDHSGVRVHTRCLRKSDGAWEGWAVWPGEKPHEKRSYYDITFTF